MSKKREEIENLRDFFKPEKFIYSLSDEEIKNIFRDFFQEYIRRPNVEICAFINVREGKLKQHILVGDKKSVYHTTAKFMGGLVHTHPWDKESGKYFSKKDLADDDTFVHAIIHRFNLTIAVRKKGWPDMRKYPKKSKKVYEAFINSNFLVRKLEFNKSDLPAWFFK